MKRARIVIVLGLIAGSLVWIAAQGLTGNLVYYSTPTELLRGDMAPGERIRLGGYVVPGSVQEDGDSVRFVVSDGTTRVTVVGTGGIPSLFREGRGVVAEGVYRDGRFHADTVLVKHGNVYRPPEPGETPHRVELEGPG